jgi:ribonuclease HII
MLKFAPDELNQLDYIIGIDEVGRGSFAGPLGVSAVVLPKDFQFDIINDSKKLSKKKRDIAFELINKHKIVSSTKLIPVRIINELGIDSATTEGFKLVLNDIFKYFSDKYIKQPEHILVDGCTFDNSTNVPHTCIPKGDGLFYPIAAASILAKVIRDAYMRELHQFYPKYCWDTNMGYHSKKHVEVIKNFGITEEHRPLFVRNFI